MNWDAASLAPELPLPQAEQGQRYFTAPCLWCLLQLFASWRPPAAAAISALTFGCGTPRNSAFCRSGTVPCNQTHYDSTVKDAAAWAGVKETLWKQMAKELGDDEIDNLLLVAGIADEDYRSAANRIDPPISALQRSSLNLLFNGIKAAMGVPTLIMQSLASTGGGAPRPVPPL